MSTASPVTSAVAQTASSDLRTLGPRKRSLGAWFADTGWRHVVAIVVSIFALFPLLYVLSASLNPKGTLTGSNQLFSAIGIDSYVRILTDPQAPYGLWFLNTLLIATVTGAVTVFIGACVIVVPWSLLTAHDLDAIQGADWLLLLGLILIPGMVGHGLMTWAHHYVDVTVTSMMTLANPVVSIVGAWILYDQELAPEQMAGGVVVLVALGAILRRQRAERALAAEAALTGDLLDE